MPNQKRAIRSAQRGPSQTAYVKRYEASADFIFPDDFDLSDHNLLLAESIRSEEHTVVFLYWTSEARARAQEPVVQKALDLSNVQIVGEVVQVKTPEMPKWTENPKKWGQWLLSIAALFGAFSVIRDHFTGLLAVPDVVLFAGNAAPTNFHAGDPMNIPLEIHNQARLGQADVHLTTAQLRSLDEITSADRLQIDITQLPVEAGQTAEVHITGTLPRPRDSRLHRYAVDVKGGAKEGFIIPRMEAAYRPFVITLWPDSSSEAHVVSISPSIARVEIKLSPGVAFTSGLRGQLTFASMVPPETDGIVLMPGATPIEKPIVGKGPTTYEGKLTLQTGPLQPFRGYSYAVSIAFQRPLTDLEWSSFRSSVKVFFA
jgi:hypothetical protein